MDIASERSSRSFFGSGVGFLLERRFRFGVSEFTASFLGSLVDGLLTLEFSTYGIAPFSESSSIRYSDVTSVAAATFLTVSRDGMGAIEVDGLKLRSSTPR